MSIIKIKPSPFHELVNGVWVINTEKKNELESLEKQKLVKSIDEAVSDIYTRFTPFQAEYELREKQARDYAESGYKGEAPEQVTAFATPAQLTTQEAADIILQQAKELRSAMSDLGVLRMRKYEVIKASTIDDARVLTSSILESIKLVADSVA